MTQILKDVKSAVKELTGEDASTIDEALELLGLEIKGKLKEKIHAAAMELDVSIFVEVREFVWAHSSQRILLICFYLHLTRSFTISSPPTPTSRMLCNYRRQMPLIPTTRRF